MVQAVGKQAETEAYTFLRSKGLQLVTRNFRSRLGEIDLIMRDKDELVFVEVRYRRSASFGGALLSIDKNKQQKISKTAEYYLYLNQQNEILGFRFDVIVFEGSLKNITWIKEAFHHIS